MWKKFKEEIPPFDKPIFVYRNKGGVFSFFIEQDDVRRCTLVRKEIGADGTWYYLKGYDYGTVTVSLTGFKECEFMNMKWMEIPKP